MRQRTAGSAREGDQQGFKAISPWRDSAKVHHRNHSPPRHPAGSSRAPTRPVGPVGPAGRRRDGFSGRAGSRRAQRRAPGFQPSDQSFIQSIDESFRIVFSNALLLPHGTPKTARDACESVFGGGRVPLRVDSAAENRLSQVSFASYPWSPGRFHQFSKPSDAADSSGPGGWVA